MIGQTISHYKITAKLGEGGMGEVYLAVDSKLDRKVALKFLPESLQEDPEARERLIREAKAASRLRHTNILTIYAVEHHAGRDFIVMEYIEGKPLTESSRDAHRSIPQVLDLAIAVAEGLQKAHAAGVIHRDLKPANILIDSDGVPRLVDFGLAKLRGTDKLTKTGSTLGTVAYMSPEQAMGQDIDARSDIFSFGVVLYELITGRTPFQGAHEAAITYAIVNEAPEPMSRFKSGVSAELERIVAKSMAKSRDERYQSMADVAADLRALRRSDSFTGQRLPLVRKRPRKWAAISAIVIGGGLVAATIALLMGHLIPGKHPDLPKRKMLAVLPFENMSPDPDQEFFSDGLTEDLIATLSSVQSLCIVSRSSAMTYKHSSKKIREIAKELGVQYIVEGSVRRSGNELRITAQLIDAANDAHLWANKYTGTMDDVFDMQDSVTHEIVRGIRVLLTPGDSLRLQKHYIDNARAYEYYLRGRDEIDKGTQEAINRGLQILSEGIKAAGENALMYSAIAEGYWTMVNSGYGDDEGVVKAEEFVTKALELDPGLADAYSKLGMINNAFLGNQREAIRLHKRALELDPTSRGGLMGLAPAYSYVGKIPEMRALHAAFAQQFPLDSIWIYFHAAGDFFFAGDYCESIHFCRSYRRLELRAPWSELIAALALAYCDSSTAALSVIDECERANPTSAIARVLGIMRAAMHKDQAAALDGLTPEVQQTCRRDAEWSWHLGAILARAGATVESYEWLENAVNRGFINYPFISNDPFLNSMRAEKRFLKLVERVKYEWEHFEA